MKANKLACVDLGTTKVCALLCEVDAAGDIELVGMGTAHSAGLKKGMVVDVQQASQSIKEAVDRATGSTKVDIDSALVGVTGGHIKNFASSSIVSISQHRGEVSEKDRSRAVSLASRIDVPNGFQVIHVIPKTYIIDGNFKVLNPVGMVASKLEVWVNVVLGSTLNLNNVEKALRDAGVDIDEIVLESIASSISVLTEREKEDGVLLLDIGGGTTDIALFKGGNVVYLYCLPVGGDHITNDISIGLRTNFVEAEALKLKYGQATFEGIGIDFSKIGVTSASPTIDEKEMLVSFLANIIECRVSELFSLVKKELSEQELDDGIGSVVLTGGTSLLTGIDDLCRSAFRLPTRIGSPSLSRGIVDRISNPIYSTAVGLLLYGAKRKVELKPVFSDQYYRESIFDKITSWFGKDRD
ncbi:MAG: cell division protein FtsA [Actinobacteria bacterium]|nr:cell division protein FtsA [Actinomycetota bacterium]